MDYEFCGEGNLVGNKWTFIKKEAIDKIYWLIKGINVEIKGKFNKKRRVRRSKIKRIKYGRIEYNRYRSIVDYYQIKTNGINGVYNIKVAISTGKIGDLA